MYLSFIVPEHTNMNVQCNVVLYAVAQMKCKSFLCIEISLVHDLAFLIDFIDLCGPGLLVQPSTTTTISA